jgi:oxygen-independent coproporphyrinogen III oxidase
MSAVLAPPLDARTVLSEDLLRKFDTPGPRYTSYPTADRFSESFGPADTVRVLEALGAAPASKPLSLYVHIPFCESLCYYCGCNKIITKHHERAAQYLDALETELSLVVESLGTGRPVSQLHFGGGSPTFLSDAELTRVMAALSAAFRLTPDSEVSIEVDPRTVTPDRLAHFRALGFNRLSFGVQDFDPDVQKAVHRVQSFDMVCELMQSARDLGYVSINADLIYGLPRQTPESFARTVGQIGELRPDRIALYAYAHLPERFKPQRRIADADLPSAVQRIAMLGDAIAGLLARDYCYIGMDHFALPDDALAVAKREGRLHRNFQGYSTQPDCDLVALGVSAIGRVGAAYYQNAKTLPDYYESLSQGRLPVVRGYALTHDDELRRDVIMALMCQGRLDFESIERAHGIRMREYFARELGAMQALAESGLVDLEAAAVQVTSAGWFLVRAIAMVFDHHLHQVMQRNRFSRIV